MKAIMTRRRLVVIVQCLAICIAVIAGLLTAIFGLSFSEPYDAVARIVALVDVVLLLAAVFKSLNSRSKYISIAVLIITALVIVVAAFASFGALQDLFGVHCTGFFGAQRSCSIVTTLPLEILLLHPIVFLPVSLLLGCLLVLGLSSPKVGGRS